MVTVPRRREDKTPCTGNDPFVNEGGGTCTNGTWVRADAASAKTADATPATSSSTPAEAKTDKAPAVAAKETSGAPTTTPAQTSSSKPKVLPSKCVGPDPFAASGGVGLCAGGEWISLWRPMGKGGK